MNKHDPSSFLLWDWESGNLLFAFVTEHDARFFVDTMIENHGADYVEQWEILHLDPAKKCATSVWSGEQISG